MGGGVLEVELEVELELEINTRETNNIAVNLICGRGEREAVPGQQSTHNN